jgi:rifampicin phosphotransferase
MESAEMTLPGPGPWEYDYSHFAKPLPRYAQDVFCQGYTEGQAIGFGRAGFPVRTMAMRIVDGYPYVQMQPLIGSPADTKLPPRWLFKLVSAVHPVLRQRFRTARAYLEGRRWREDVREWDEVLKPNLVSRLEALSAEDPAALDDAALIGHLERCRAAILEDMHIHFTVNPTVIVPVGRFLGKAEAWTGATAAELLALISWGADTRDPELDALVDAIHTAGCESWLESDGMSAAEVLEALTTAEGPLGGAARAWVARMSVRQLSAGDLSNPTGAEVPELLVENLRRMLSGASQRQRQATDYSGMRDRVPHAHREEFDALLEEARHVHRLRDERCTMLDVWAMGLCRRALLEAGARLVRMGALREREHVLELEHGELVSLMAGGGGPTAAEVAERDRARRSRHADAPRFLGGEPPPPPPADYFPAPVAEMMRSVFRYVDDMNGTMEPESVSQGTVLTGRAASRGRARGSARIVSGPEDFGKVRSGDILVARTTMPSYNGVLPLLAGIVTDYGGALCHAAIVAREYGIPAVVNTRVATTTIPDGALVEIDGDQGSVRVHP